MSASRPGHTRRRRSGHRRSWFKRLGRILLPASQPRRVYLVLGLIMALAALWLGANVANWLAQVSAALPTGAP